MMQYQKDEIIYKIAQTIGIIIAAVCFLGGKESVEHPWIFGSIVVVLYFLGI